MTKRGSLQLLGILGVLCCVMLRPVAAVTMGTAFTYLGHLTEGSSPADGIYDFKFSLYDAATGGSQLGSEISRDDIDVENGCFTVELDYGDSCFDGDARWLEISVREGLENFATLTPRQELTPSPYSLYAERVGNITVSGDTVQIDSAAVPMIFRETDASLPNGLYRFVTDGGQFRIDKNTAAGGDFATMTIPFYVKADGTVHFDGGNVGIDTWSPQYKLHVTDSTPSLAMFESTSTAAVIALFDSTTSAGGQNALVRMGDNLTLRTLDYERLAIKSNGYVGVNTFYPRGTLDVNGELWYVTNRGNSDERLKKNVEPLSDVLDKLDRIRAVSFLWNEEARVVGGEPDTKQIGVLAQEVEQVFPELVSTPTPVSTEELIAQYPETMRTPKLRQRLDDDAARSHYKGVSYDQLTVVVLQAAKELRVQNQALEAKVVSLEQRIEALESRGR